MTIIANPLYDSVFKYLMEDEKVARMLLSALLQKDVLELQMRRHEYTSEEKTAITIYRVDFSAKVRNKDGVEQLILIELQKTWLATETARFREYLGAQYQNKENIPPKEKNPKGYALPIVSIYILGHKLGDLKEPVIYIRRSYLDYDSKPIGEGVPDPFVESLTHDSIIVQIPYLQQKTRNRLERLLCVFDQKYAMKGNTQLLEIDEQLWKNQDEQLLINRLAKAASAPNIRKAMSVEDEFLSEIDARDSEIMQQNKVIERQEKALQQKDEALQQKDEALQQKDEALQQKEATILQQQQVIRSLIPLLAASGKNAAEIAAQLSITEEEVLKAMKP